MWLNNCWYVAAYSSEIGHTPLSRRLLGERVLLYRMSGGKVAALRDRCPHRLLPLSNGDRVGDDIQCAYHGLRFAPDGRCSFIPGQPEIPSNARVSVYPLVESQGLCWIWIGDAALADEGAVPDFPWTAHSAWMPSVGYLHVASDYRLTGDNLLDLSHETYVHRHTIGNDSKHSIANFPVDIDVIEGQTIRIHREMRGIDPPPFFSMILRSAAPINRWQTALYSPPGIHMTEAGVHHVNAPRSQAYVSRVMHLLTPETPTSTHYFGSVNRNYHIDDRTMTADIGKALHATFEEDRVILEAQQQSINENGDAKLPQFAVRLDEGPLRGRRLLDKYLQLQASDPRYVMTPPRLVPDEKTTPAMILADVTDAGPTH